MFKTLVGVGRETRLEDSHPLACARGVGKACGPDLSLNVDIRPVDRIEIHK